MTALQEAPDKVAEEIRLFCNKTLVSKRNNARLLGISPSTLVRWLDGTTEPYDWTARQVLRRIELFAEEDKRNGLYSRLVSMTPRERMAALGKVLEDQDNQTCA